MTATTFKLFHAPVLNIVEISQLLPNFFRFLMSWLPADRAVDIGQATWLNDRFPHQESAGKCFELIGPRGKKYTYYPVDGGGRSSDDIPQGVASEDIIRVTYPQGTEDLVVLALQGARGAIEGTELLPAYSKLLEEAVGWIQGETPREEKECLGRLQKLFLTGEDSPATLESLARRIYPTFFSYRFSGYSMADFLIIKKFSLARGLEKLNGRPGLVGLQDSLCFLNSTSLRESVLLGAFSGNNEAGAVRDAARGLLEAFTAPVPDERLFRVRHSSVLALGELLYSEGEDLVCRAKQSEALFGFYDHLFYAFSVVRASRVCFEYAMNPLWGEEEAIVKRLERRCDELETRIYASLSIACLYSPSEFFMDEVASSAIACDRKGEIYRNIYLADMFDNQIIYPDFCREAIIAEVERNQGNARFSEEFMEFVRVHFRRMLIPSWPIDRIES